MPPVTDFVESWLQNVKAHVFNRNDGQRFFQQARGEARIVGDERVRKPKCIAREPDVVLVRWGYGVRYRNRRNLCNRFVVIAITRFEQLNGLADRHTSPGLVAEPGDYGNVTVGVQPLIPIGPCRRWYAVASLPGTKCIRGNTGAQDNRTCVVDWPCRESAEEFHGLYSFSLDYTYSAATRFVTCATMDARAGHEFVFLNSSFLTVRLGGMRRFRGIRSARLTALLAGTLLVGCAEEGAGPQFASDPRPTRVPTVASGRATPALLPTAVPALSPVVVATPASLTDLLAVRGAVSRVFIAFGDAVWSIASDGDAFRLFDAPEGSSIRAIDPAPSAQQVAILLEVPADGGPNAEVVVLDASGEVLTRVTDVEEIPGTPTTGTGTGTQTIDWSPQGDRVLVSVSGGKIVDIVVGEDSAPSVLDVGAERGSTIDPRWSPTGETIAFISESPDGRSRSLMILDSSDGAISDVVAPSEGRLVVDFAWMPDGVSLLFTEGGEPGRAATGIDLWRVDANGENRRLVASAGTVAPVARIANLSPSPDGRSVAYSVLVPGPAGPLVDSVWVREYASGVGFRIPLPSVASVEDIWWTDEGLILSVVTFGTPQSRQPAQALLQLQKDGSVAALWAAPVAVGTPITGTPLAAATSR